MRDSSDGFVYGLVLVCFILLIFLIASIATLKNVGTEGHGCYGNKTCDDGLSCYSDTCVKVEGEE